MRKEWPQVTMIALATAGWFMTLKDHGKPKEGKENIFLSSISVAISFYLMWAGGFFG